MLTTGQVASLLRHEAFWNAPFCRGVCHWMNRTSAFRLVVLSVTSVKVKVKTCPSSRLFLERLTDRDMAFAVGPTVFLFGVGSWAGGHKNGNWREN